MTKQTMWGEPDSERLTHFDADECIESIIDEWHPTPFKEMPDVTVEEYKPRQPKDTDGGWPLESVLEHLDEEYGDPEGDPTEQTEAMKKAERAFVEAVIAEYRPWAHEPTGKAITVNALEWVREHRPDWLSAEPREGGG